MRLTKPDLRGGGKHNPKVTFGAELISAYGGLEWVRRFFAGKQLHLMIRDVFQHEPLGGDYRAASMVSVILALFFAGGRRIEHLKYLANDFMIRRLCALRRLPRPTTMARWLCRFTVARLGPLVELNRRVVYKSIEQAGLSRLTIDVDGTVVRTGQTVEWAKRGYNPHQRRHPSYYPLLAHIAQTSQILRVKNRPGNVHDSKGAVAFLRELVDDLRKRLPQVRQLAMRMDSAFFQGKIMDFLDARRIAYAIKVPFAPWLGLVGEIRARQRWSRLAKDMGCFELSLTIKAWERVVRIVIYRKRVHHKSPKNYQLDLFDPDDGYWEYSAVATNLDLTPKRLWDFMAGRGAQEKTFGELKTEWAFDVVPTKRYGANSAWQQISVLGHNLLRWFQLSTGAAKKPRSSKRTFSYLFQSLRTVRFTLICQPVRQIRPRGRTHLRYAVAPATADTMRTLEKVLANAA